MKYKLLVIGFISAGLTLLGCSSKKSAPPASSKSGKNDCSTKASTSKTSTKSGLRNSFALAGSTYDDIKSIIDDECVSCHVAGGVAGLDLSTYKALKSNAAKVIETINADDDTVMPPEGKMKSADIDKVQLWVDDGTLDDSSSSSAAADDEEEEAAEPTKSTTAKKATTSDCEKSDSSAGDDDSELETDGDETAGGTTAADGEDKPVVKPKVDEIDPKLFDMYIETIEMKNCFASGKPFLRTGTKTPDDPTPRCDTGVNYPAQFTCDKAGVLAAFKNDANVVTAVDANVAEGYLFDQCGEAAGKPVVYFVCFSGADGICVAKDKLAGGTLTIKTAYIGRP